MAIQNRRGDYNDFDPQQLVPGEWAVVLSGDPHSTRGKAVYMAFDVGDVERMATYEDMQENIVSATTDVQAQFAAELTQTINDANSAVDDMQTSIDNEIQSASDTVATLTTNTNTAINSARQATTQANDAAETAFDAAESVRSIIESGQTVASWNNRTGLVVPVAGDYTSQQITHDNTTVADMLVFDETPSANSNRAVKSGGVYAQRRNNLAAGYGTTGTLGTAFSIVPMEGYYAVGTSFQNVSDGGYRALRTGLLLASAYVYISGVNASDVVALNIGRYNGGWVWESPTVLVAGTTERTGFITNFPIGINADDIVYLRARNITAARGSIIASRLVLEYI